MDRYFHEFTVDIVDEDFKFKDVSYPKTAVIKLRNNETETEEIVKKGFIDVETIYDKLDKNQPINLDYCYIENFSIKEFKKKYNIEQNQIFEIKSFSAEHSFINNSSGNLAFDLSELIIYGEKFSLNNAIIAAKEYSFSRTVFKSGISDFEYILFHNGMVDFSHSKFNYDNVSFKNAVFKTGDVVFEDAEFKYGVNFVNCDFGEGNISFSAVHFGEGRTTFRISHFGNGKKDFSRAVFGNGDFSFEKCEFKDGDVNFRTVQFGEGKVDFTRCIFGKGQVNFTNTKFNKGNVSFTGSDFNNGKVNFKLAEFDEGNIDFHFCQFGKGDIIFERTKFRDGNLDFRAVNFGAGRIVFNRTEIGNGDMIFEASEMNEGTITFRYAVFGNGVFNFDTAIYNNSELIIDEVDFGQGKVSFKRSQFKKMVFRSCQMNNYFDLRVEKCGELDLSDTIVKDILDLRAYEFEIKIDKLDLTGIRLLGRIYIDWKEAQLKKLIYQQDTSLRNKSEQFRVLKENFHTIGMYQEEDDAYVEFKRSEAKADLKEAIGRNKNNKFWAYPNYWLKWLIFDKMGLYATNPVRVLISMFVTYLLFVILYIILNLTGMGDIIYGIGDEHILSIVTKCMYFSGITFLTIGYGDFYPVGIDRIWAGIEGFIGLFMMSYFTVAFVRKILR